MAGVILVFCRAVLDSQLGAVAVIIYVDPNINGNVFIRERPDRDSKSVKIPAYNYKHYGCLYETDRESEDSDGNSWYHIRGLGWSMAKYFAVADDVVPGGDGGDADTLKNWVVGLTRSEAEQCVAYLKGQLEESGDG